MRIHSYVHVCVRLRNAFLFRVFLLGVFYAGCLNPIARYCKNSNIQLHVAMDQYLLIPFLGGWTSIYQLFWCSPGVQGFDTLPCVYQGWTPPWIVHIKKNMVSHPPTKAACPRCHLCTWSKDGFFSETSIELGKESDMKQPRSHSFILFSGPRAMKNHEGLQIRFGCDRPPWRWKQLPNACSQWPCRLLASLLLTIPTSWFRQMGATGFWPKVFVESVSLRINEI